MTRDLKAHNMMTNLSYKLRMGRDGTWSQPSGNFHLDCQPKNSQSVMARKMRNKNQKIKNGNRVYQSKLKILHWNLGSRQWKNKIEDIELLLSEYKPDLCYVSEANMWNNLEPHERELEGHSLILPNTMSTLQHARLVLIVKDGIEVTVLNQFMDKDIASIWVMVGTPGKKSLRVGGAYRQHKLLGQDYTTTTRQEIQEQQEERWVRLVAKWRAASRNSKCILIGDINLDFNLWNSPEQHEEKMIELVQTEIEPLGYIQLVGNITRAWKNQKDSIIDHIWTNCSDRVLKQTNDLRTLSDHNVIGMDISLKEIKLGGQNVVRRRWKDYDEKRCLEKFSEINWSQLYDETNPDVANSLLEELIVEVLESEAPMVTMQEITRYSSWLDVTTKAKMLERDMARELARISGSNPDWDSYRQLRNQSTRMQRADKTRYQKKMFDKFELENDTSKLYGMTKSILGWKKTTPPTCFQEEGRPIRKQQELATSREVEST